MTVRRPLPAFAAALSLGVLSFAVVACTEAETDTAEVRAEQAGEKAEDLAAQTGEVIEAGAMKAAQAVESGAGKVADKLEDNQAEAAAEGRAGAINPATDQRVPSN
jgi:hypothetical protein